MKLPLQPNSLWEIFWCSRTKTYSMAYIVIWSSSVSVVSDYALNDRGSIPGRVKVRGKRFFLYFCVQISPEAHPASYPMGSRGSFPGSNAQAGRDADHSPHLVPRPKMSKTCFPLPLSPCMAISGTVLLFIYFHFMTYLATANFSPWAAIKVSW
jgi:hypothetical protein